jgi:hypothetical protein
MTTSARSYPGACPGVVDSVEYDGKCAFAVSTGKTDVPGGTHRSVIHGKTYTFSNIIAKLLFIVLPGRVK